MTPRKATTPRVDATRETASTLTVHGRRVQPGTELSIAGIRGRCVFRQHVRHQSGAEWVDVLTSRGKSRSVRPDAIRTVHTRRRLGVLA